MAEENENDEEPIPNLRSGAGDCGTASSRARKRGGLIVKIHWIALLVVAAVAYWPGVKYPALANKVGV